jgi:hypothetical protein
MELALTDDAEGLHAATDQPAPPQTTETAVQTIERVLRIKKKPKVLPTLGAVVEKLKMSIPIFKQLW